MGENSELVQKTIITFVDRKRNTFIRSYQGEIYFQEGDEIHVSTLYSEEECDIEEGTYIVDEKEDRIVFRERGELKSLDDSVRSKSNHDLEEGKYVVDKRQDKTTFGLGDEEKSVHDSVIRHYTFKHVGYSESVSRGG